MQPALGVKALMSGDVDYLLAWGSALRAAVTGVPIKAVLGFAGRPLHVLIARPEIKTPRDLKGKVVGVDSVAGTVDYLSRVALRHFGLEPDRDVTIIVTGESPTRLAALRAGSIDATPIDVAFAVKAEDEGFRRLVYLGDLIELPLSGIAVTESKLQRRRDQIKKVARAGVRGARFMKQNRPETIQMLSDYLGITPAQAARAYDAAINSFTTDGMISDKGVQLDIQLTKERLKITRDIPLQQLVDWSVVRELQAERQ
jgi:ABC-type nitrate/sulfonate/bicarbonate transport system substrate-binding protein